MAHNIIVGQSGGQTSVINSSLADVFATAKEDVTDFDEGTQTGSVMYSTGTFKVTVSLKNGKVSSVTIR